MENFLWHMLRLGDFVWELRNHQTEELLREPPRAEARVQRWLIAAEGNTPPPRALAGASWPPAAS